ncbi:MAG: hypothetical protein ACXACI_01415 [Candidatus Hodarchaeales archaeon]|jgi:hypothetical protein
MPSYFEHPKKQILAKDDKSVTLLVKSSILLRVIFLNRSSNPDLPFRFPFLLIETLVIGLLLGLTLVWIDLMDEWIFAIEAMVLVLLAVFAKITYNRKVGAEHSERSSLRDDMDKIDVGYTSAKKRHTTLFPSRTFGDRPDTISLNPFRRSGSGILISKQLVDNIWRAFLLAALGLLVYGATQSSNPLLQHYGQWAFLWGLLFAAYIGMLLGFLHLIRNPRVSVSRVFDVYINLGALLFGIPFGVFFLFILGAAVILMFVPVLQTTPQQALVPFAIVALIVIFVMQALYLFSTINKYAAERGLSASEYIRLKLSREERERTRLEKLAHKKRIDSLYERLPEIKERIHPGAIRSPAAHPIRSMDDYEYAKDEKNPFFAFVREFIPALLGIIIGNAVFIAGFFALAALLGY